MPSRQPSHRSPLQVAGIAAIVFIGTAFAVWSESPSGIVGSALYLVLPAAWLTVFCSLAAMALEAARRP